MSGDTLMARITPCLENGKIAQIPIAERDSLGHGSTELMVFRGRPEVSDSNLVYYLVRSDDVIKFAISQMSGTSGRQRVPVEALRYLRIRLPSLPEQRAIAYVLGTLDDKIELNRRMNKTLEEIARAIFKSWFIDFDPVRAKAEGRDPGLPKHIADLFPDRLNPSEQGEIPEGWKIGYLGDVAANIRRSIKPEDIGHNCPYIALEHMPRRCIGLSKWGVAGGLQSSKFSFECGEILFSKLRPYFHKVGVAPVGGVCSSDILVVALKRPSWFGLVLF